MSSAGPGGAPLVVRRVRPSEWRKLRELRLASLVDAPQAFGQTQEKAALMPDAEWRANARAAASGDSRTWLIAARAGLDVGVVQARRRAPQDCLVFSMWVAPAERRSGAGRLLLDGVARWAAGWGSQRMVLWVFATNEAAQRFYERIGFSIVVDGPDADSGRSFGAFAMERSIASAPA